MPVEINKEFSFEAAHFIPAFPEGHKCRRMHGHSFRVSVRIAGEINPETGILMDFADLKEVVKPYIEFLDHHCLNTLGEEHQIELLQNPTSENLAKWLWQELKPRLPQLKHIWVAETCTSSCTYYE